MFTLAPGGLWHYPPLVVAFLSDWIISGLFEPPGKRAVMAAANGVRWWLGITLSHVTKTEGLDNFLM